MIKPDKIAWQWLFVQPPLKGNDTRQRPVDFGYRLLLDKFMPPVQSPVSLEAIRQRSILYSKAGCSKDACGKSALRDYLEAVR